MLAFYSLLKELLLSSKRTARAYLVGGHPPDKRKSVRPFYGLVTSDHVGQPGRHSSFLVYLEQLSERHCLTAFQLGITSQRIAQRLAN